MTPKELTSECHKGHPAEHLFIYLIEIIFLSHQRRIKRNVSSENMIFYSPINFKKCGMIPHGIESQTCRYHEIQGNSASFKVVKPMLLQ